MTETIINITREFLENFYYLEDNKDECKPQLIKVIEIFSPEQIVELEMAMANYDDDSTILNTAYENKIKLLVRNKLTKIVIFNNEIQKIKPKDDELGFLTGGEDIQF